jgi:hypothetical protein
VSWVLRTSFAVVLGCHGLWLGRVFRVRGGGPCIVTERERRRGGDGADMAGGGLRMLVRAR